MTTPPQITVYGRPACSRCHTTTAHLERLGLPYTYRDVTTDEAAYDAVAVLGYQELPVVTVGDMHWSGYRHSKIKQLAEIHAAAPDVAGLESAAVEFLAGGEAL
ncbi:glutaredoxin family protein [Nocardia asiatica]|uniref:glutaredoxin family protein n=1 Tax=Nocardia asiatica TaxID=209252 RepID=UPI0002E95A5E|nr:glutaredoxin family protein [Nocardia asiatica]